MKIAVLNGSPKNKISVTMQYVAWLSKEFPQHDFTLHPIAAQIDAIEKDEARFNAIIDSVRESDAVLWAYPLYVFLVHADYKRFIELLSERKAGEAFQGKPAFQLSTSIHFFDHTANAYIRGICDDLGMRSLGVFSAEMRDLHKAEMRESLREFMCYVEEAVKNRLMPSPQYAKIKVGSDEIKMMPSKEMLPLYGKKAVVLVDGYAPDSNLGRMVDAFCRSFDVAPDLINLDDILIKTGCRGCLHCGYDNKCIYQDSDDVIALYERLRGYDIVVYALPIRDRYFSARWKRFVDRRFYRTHQPILENAQLAYLISGPLQQLPVLREIIDAGAELDGTGLIGIATDEGETPEAGLEALCRAVSFRAGHVLRLPTTFLGVGGKKLFRDEMWGPLRSVFVADHKYYKQHGYYDFPQNDYKTRCFNFIFVPLLGISFIRRWWQNNMKENMIRSYRHLIEGKN